MPRSRPRPALTHETAATQLARLAALEAVLMKQAGARGLAEAPEALVLMVRALVAETRALLDAPGEGDGRPAGRRGWGTAQVRRVRARPGRTPDASLLDLPAPPRRQKGMTHRAASVSFAELAVIAGQARAVLAAHVAARGLDRPQAAPNPKIDELRARLVARFEQLKAAERKGDLGSGSPNSPPGCRPGT
jgi:hypothetical protein